MSIFSALKEFSFAVNVLYPIMVPATPRVEKRKALNATLNELSEDTFKRRIIAKRILSMNMIDMSEGICKEYDSVESQTNGILEWLPRMGKYQSMLLKEVKKHRQEYGLPL